MKARKKIPMENKVRAELQKQISSKCPFCENEDVGHFQIHHIDENHDNNEILNLILICPNCHSKMTKKEIAQEIVFKKKIELLSSQVSNKKEQSSKTINFNNSKVGNNIIGDNNIIITKTQKSKYPEGCIGFDSIKANYIGYLISRFNEYKEYEVGKGNVKYGLFGAQLKKYYKIGSTRTIYNLPIEKFDDLVQLIQSKINGTKLAKVKGKNHKNYLNFNEYTKS
uniref:HNH nuclease n=1 Tax=Chlorobium chlorochromatii (strain CaD3) TaxID=340177 RepID=Q3AR05_CHLCH